MAVAKKTVVPPKTKTPAKKASTKTAPKISPTEEGIKPYAGRVIKWNSSAEWLGVKPNAIDPDKETNRAKWMRHVKAFQGKTVGEWEADLKAEGFPALPTSKAEKTTYTPGMWLGWMVRVKVVELADAE